MDFVELIMAFNHTCRFYRLNNNFEEVYFIVKEEPLI